MRIRTRSYTVGLQIYLTEILYLAAVQMIKINSISMRTLEGVQPLFTSFEF